MLDEFVELMYAYYESELDMSIYTMHGSMIEHRIFKPGTGFSEYMSVFIYVSNQTKGFYIDLTENGETKNRINTYTAPKIIEEWNNLYE